MVTRYLVGFLLAALLAGCHDDNSTANTPSHTISGQSDANSAPNIFGNPLPAARAGGFYAFQPIAKDSNGDRLSFAIANKPVWASFNASNGELSGIPRADQIGKFSGIVISVSDGHVTVSLPAFSVQVMDATKTPMIAGTPSHFVLVGNSYSFTPVASDPNGQALTFSVQNLPSWATFNESTGELSGTPDGADVGTFAGILISVSNGTQSDSLPAFTIAVNQSANGSATLSWLPPAQNTDGTPLTNLAGFYIYYGTNSASLTQSVKITNPSVSTYVVSNLTPETWYFSVKAFTNTNVESDFSARVSKTIL